MPDDIRTHGFSTDSCLWASDRDSTPAGEERQLRCTSEGALLVQQVTTSPEGVTAARITPNVDVASSTIVTASAARRGGFIYNPTATPIHVNLEGGTATSSDPIVQQYGMLTFGPVTNAISAISTSGTVVVTAVTFT